MSKKDRCSICAHKKRCQIDQSVTDGVSYRHIAEKFKVGYKSIERHVKNGHVDEAIKAAANDNKVKHGKTLQEKLDEAYDLSLEAAKHARKKDVRAFGGCIGGVMKALEIEARIKVPEKKDVNLNLSGGNIDARLELLAERRRERKASTNQ